MWLEWGYWGLFFASFLAATVIPFSSEVVLTAMLAAGGDPAWSLVAATAGNWLGGLSSYGIGYLGKLQWIEKYLRIPPSKIERIKKKIAGKELWIATLCWLPGIGDVIAVVLGLLKTNFWLTAAGMLLGKALRYAVWGYLTLKAMNYF